MAACSFPSALHAFRCGPSSDVAEFGLRDEIRRRVEAWREMMTRHTTQARQLLRKMLRGRPILFVPTVEDDQVGYRFRGDASVSELLAGLVNLPLSVASPTSLAPFLRGRIHAA